MATAGEEGVKFKTIEEVKAYYSGDKIECLECGRMFRALGQHLKTHSITPDEYKEKYGLPYTWGLVSQRTKVLMSEIMTHRLKDPDVKKNAVNNLSSNHHNKRGLCNAVKNQNRALIKDCTSKSKRIVSTTCDRCGAEIKKQIRAIGSNRVKYCDACSKIRRHERSTAWVHKHEYGRKYRLEEI